MQRVPWIVCLIRDLGSSRIVYDTTERRYSLLNKTSPPLAFAFWTPGYPAVKINLVSENGIPTVSGNGPPSAPDVTIIVVNWNLKGYLSECLKSINQFGGSLVETIVVDNASSDGSVEMVEREFPEARLIRNSGNVGFSRANNQAMADAAGRYYLLLNNDALLFENALPRLIEYMDSHTDTGICGPRVLNEDGTLQVRSKGRYPSIRTAFFHFFFPASWQHRGSRPLGFYEFKDSMEARPVEWVSGCALMARREAVADVGMLDADVFMYCEDVDWCYRMKRAGWAVTYVPAADVLHYAGRSMKKQKGKVVGAFATGLVAFYSKYHGKALSAIFRLVLLAGYGIQATGWVIDAIRGRGAGYDKLKRLFIRRGQRSGQ